MKRDSKKIIIIGGGVAGLSAGIYGQRAGFDTVIYEKNTVAGGSCSGWFRDGYAIDNCLHWLTGTAIDTGAYDMWRELGVINDDTEMFTRDCFWSSETDGVTVTLWPDSEKTRREMLAISPEDADEINSFIDVVNMAGDLVVGKIKMPGPKHGLGMENLFLYRDFAKKAMKYLNIRNTAWADKFKSKAIRNLILDFCPKEYESYWLILSYSFFVSGNANLIKGGSIQMAKSLLDTYRSEGGQIVFNAPVKQVKIGRERFNVKDIKDSIFQRAKGIVLENGEFITADYIVCACDINYIFAKLITKKFLPQKLREAYRNHASYTFYSAFQVAFSVDGEFEEVPDSLSFDCGQIEAGYEKYNRIGIKNYRKYGDYIAPEGKTVIQVSLDQYKRDCRFWKKEYERDIEDYNRSKKNVAEAILHEIEKKFPQYAGKLCILDIWTPYSYERRNNDVHGAFMRFITTVFSVNAFMSNEVAGLHNVVLAGHYLRYPGGLPTAALTGKEAIKLIESKEKEPLVLQLLKKNEILVKDEDLK